MKKRLIFGTLAFVVLLSAASIALIIIKFSPQSGETLTTFNFDAATLQTDHYEKFNWTLFNIESKQQRHPIYPRLMGMVLIHQTTNDGHRKAIHRQSYSQQDNINKTHTFSPSHLLTLSPLHFSLFVIAVVGTVGNDDVVEEADAHQLASLLDGVGEVVVHTAWHQTA